MKREDEPRVPRFVKEDGVLVERDHGISRSERVIRIGSTGRPAQVISGELPGRERAVRC